MKNPQLFTADWHLRHAKIMEYDKRPFETIEAMEDVFFNNLKEMWEPGSTLYFLGDMSLNNKTTFEALDRLLAIGIKNVVYVFGNHDGNNSVRNAVEKHRIVPWCGDLKTIKLRRSIDSVPAFLCHYPMRSWNMSSHGARHLHGHSHGGSPEHFNSLDVGIDNANRLLGDYRPFTAQEVCEQIDGRINVELADQRSSVLEPADKGTAFIDEHGVVGEEGMKVIQGILDKQTRFGGEND